MLRSNTSATAVLLILFAALLGWETQVPAQSLTLQAASPAASPSPTPKPLRQISYLKDGGLWMVKEDGSDNRQLVAAPEEAAIANQIWARDGGRIFFNIGLNLHTYVLQDQKVENLGALEVPESVALDRIELGNDNKTLLAHTIDTNDALNSVPKIYAVTFAPFAARELSIDEYHTLAPTQSSLVTKAGDLSVSPDGRFVLFAEAVEKDIQLFVSDIETGNRHQITDLSLLEGFEPEATQEGGRRILEATWSPDGRHIVFVPAQSCSEFGLCAGRTFLVDAWGGAQLQLAAAPTASLVQEWNQEKKLMVYDDNGQLVIADTQGQLKPIGEGIQPKWQPVA